jgi:hypothetical protein
MAMTRSLSVELGDVIKPLSCEAPVAAMCTSRGDSCRTRSPEKGHGRIARCRAGWGRASQALLADPGGVATMFTSSPHHAHPRFTAPWLGVCERMGASLREDQTVESTTRRTEVWSVIGRPVGSLPPCLVTELVRSGLSSATLAPSTLSVRASASRASRPTPETGAVNEGTSSPSLSF